jgi:hypothetical protein
MGDQHTAPAEAYDPDPDRVDPDSPDLMPAWAAYLIALLIIFLLEHSLSMRQRRARRLASKPVARPALPQDSAQTADASIPSQSDAMAARTRRGQATAPEEPELPSVLNALLAKLLGCDSGKSLWSQLEALGIVPSLIDPDPAPAPVRTPLCSANIRRAPRRLPPTSTQHAVLPAPRRQIARRGTGPPTGPPAVSHHQTCYA